MYEFVVIDLGNIAYASGGGACCFYGGDFDYGGNYDVEEVRAQMQGVYDAGLDSWMLWNASNRYTRGALLPAENDDIPQEER